MGSVKTMYRLLMVQTQGSGLNCDFIIKYFANYSELEFTSGFMSVFMLSKQFWIFGLDKSLFLWVKTH